MDGITVRFDDQTRTALHTKAAAEGVSDGEMVRRFVRQGLALEAPSEQAQAFLQAMRVAMHDEMRQVHRLSYIAARQSALGNHWTRRHWLSAYQWHSKASEETMDRFIALQDDMAAKDTLRVLRDPLSLHPDEGGEVVPLPPQDAALFEDQAGDGEVIP